MYKTSKDQLEFENFNIPFNGKLNEKNIWMQLSKIIPWDFVEDLYVKSLSQSNQGKSAISSRIAFGSLVIQSMEHLRDRKLVQQISENPYLQCFLGYKAYLSALPFDVSLLVYFRQCFTLEMIDAINERIASQDKVSKFSRKKLKLSSDMESILDYKIEACFFQPYVDGKCYEV